MRTMEWYFCQQHKGIGNRGTLIRRSNSIFSDRIGVGEWIGKSIPLCRKCYEYVFIVEF